MVVGMLVWWSMSPPPDANAYEARADLFDDVALFASIALVALLCSFWPPLDS
jgi:hypothetical protein